MLTTALGKTADLLDKRFLVGLVLPCLGFIAVITVLVITGLGWDRAHRTWTTTSAGGRWTIAIVAVAALLLLAALLGTQVTNLVRVWEGYWPDPLRRFGQRRQRRKYTKLKDSNESDSARKQLQFPTQPDDFLPTRLGNTLLAAENHSRERYGIDSVVFWPRQYMALPGDIRALVDDARRTLDQLVVIASLAVLACLAALSLPIVSLAWKSVSAPPVVWLPLAAGGLLVALLSYQSAVAAAAVFGDAVRSVFDLYRTELLIKLGVASPHTRAIERQTWEALGQLIYRGGTTAEGDALIEYR
ncbi:hypothetical protein [Mycobacteroides abscessus]|uniref:hypothetical protein n=1 Tax=Mycobacteroides abscessus TaxID=36809 RepID=UPI000926DA8E|nr:hypothetical protein [Mycobacteroides abscessus]MDO3333864.1 hypothetical protein [Mycobacteroides abscessus subsp. bolletii]QSM86914.1 hypothetical protein I3U44_13485 [Mycobacteroides abscessus subsp. bolletii]SIB88038.1 Uncharacterised protein [Mycobacteroides abscessus subsp. bolletii]SIJ25055.1 Uncharacterised protein [Mycobacteroides abscessus subsp. bolletii]SKS89591.1 Uncharacterised protein [Mycobacteroides abscessus subsp. bolletii]